MATAGAGALGRLPGIRRPPRSPPADSANWVSGPKRFDTSPRTSENVPIWAGNWAKAGVASVSARRLSPGATAIAGPLMTCIISSAALTVRVTCGIAARSGGSMSETSELIRSVVSFRFSMVRLKFSTPLRNSSTPLRNCSIDLTVPDRGVANSVNRSASGSGRSSGMSTTLVRNRTTSGANLAAVVHSFPSVFQVDRPTSARGSSATGEGRSMTNKGGESSIGTSTPPE